MVVAAVTGLALEASAAAGASAWSEWTVSIADAQAELQGAPAPLDRLVLARRLDLFGGAGAPAPPGGPLFSARYAAGSDGTRPPRARLLRETDAFCAQSAAHKAPSGAAAPPAPACEGLTRASAALQGAHFPPSPPLSY